MLAPPMSRRLAAALLCVLVFPFTAALTGCGEEETSHVPEGEPLELGELSYNIQLTRFLNPNDTEDAEYLAGQAPEQPGQSYLGVFLVIENESEEELPSAEGYEVVDTQDQAFEPLESESPYALEIGSTVPAEGELPLPGTTAQSGPIQGAMLVFLVDDSVTENRPLELEIAGGDAAGTVELDI
jgi:hypothetical protein